MEEQMEMLATLRYPCGYSHDLSLITAPSLPDVLSPPGYPVVTGWGHYSSALGQKDVYVVCHQTNVGKWRHIALVADPKLYKRATILGTGYSWSKIDRSQNAFVLWHTGPELSPADGWSGSPLCLGSPSGTSSQAVVFQNFQQACKIGGDTLFSKKKKTLIKAGFVLPSEIRSSIILGSEGYVNQKKFNTDEMGI